MLLIFVLQKLCFPEWRDIVKIGVAECTPNPDLCRDMGVKQVPTIRLFPPHSHNTSLGENIKKGSVEEFRVTIVKQLKKYQSQNQVEGTVYLNPVTDLYQLHEKLSFYFSNKVEFVILVFESEDSIAGAELALDLSRTEKVRVLSVHLRNTSKFGSKKGADRAKVVDRNWRRVTLQLGGDLTRYTLNKAARLFLVNRGINVSLNWPSTDNSTEISNSSDFDKIITEIKKKFNITDLNTAVFRNDLQSAVHYSFMNEVALSKVISGVQLGALKNYLHVLIKYFPSGQNERECLKELLRTAIGDKKQIRGKNFSQTFAQLQKEYKAFLPELRWIACMGSSPEFRGYPCGLWTLFHTMIVQELVQNSDNSKRPEVLPAMVGYIKHYFTCSECAAHFAGMANTITGNVTTRRDSVLWLWAAHNVVNKRLAGGDGEDPKHKKMQFPSKAACPSCRARDNSWNKPQVLNFLTKMFTKIFFLNSTKPDDAKKTNLKSLTILLVKATFNSS